jgi:hypothetical protein
VRTKPTHKDTQMGSSRPREDPPGRAGGFFFFFFLFAEPIHFEMHGACFGCFRTRPPHPMQNATTRTQSTAKQSKAKHILLFWV